MKPSYKAEFLSYGKLSVKERGNIELRNLLVSYSLLFVIGVSDNSDKMLYTLRKPTRLWEK